MNIYKDVDTWDKYKIIHNLWKNDSDSFKICCANLLTVQFCYLANLSSEFELDKKETDSVLSKVYEFTKDNYDLFRESRACLIGKDDNTFNYKDYVGQMHDIKFAAPAMQRFGHSFLVELSVDQSNRWIVDPEGKMKLIFGIYVPFAITSKDNYFSNGKFYPCCWYGDYIWVPDDHLSDEYFS